MKSIISILKIKNIFLKFFISYVLLLVIFTLSITILLFNNFSKSSLRQINDISQKNLLQSKSIVEYIMNQAKQTCLQLSSSYDVTNQITSKDKNSFTESRVLNNMRDIKYINDSIDSITLYNGAVDEYLSTPFPNTFDKDFIAWLNKSNIRSLSQIIPRKINQDPNKTKKIYSVFYYEKSNDSISDAIIVNISMMSIEKGLNDLATKGDKLSIVNKSGMVVYSSIEDSFLKDVSGQDYIKKVISLNGSGNFASVIDNKKMFITYTYSESLGWYFTYPITYEEATSSISNIRNSAVLILVLIILLSLIVSAIISGNISLPFRRILGNISQLNDPESNQKETNMSETEILTKYYFDTMNEIKRLKIINDSSSSILKNEHLRDLLRGIRMPQSSDIDEYKTNIDLCNFKVLHVVLINVNENINFHNLETEESKENIHNNIRLILCDVSKNFIKEFYPCEAVEIDNKVALFIISYESDSSKNFEEIFLKLHEKIQNTYNISTSISVGKSIGKNNEIGESYESAIETSLYKFIYGESKILFYGDVMNHIQYKFDYPYNKEKALIEAIRMEKWEQVEIIIDSIFDIIKDYQYHFIVMSVNHIILSVFTINKIQTSNSQGRSYESLRDSLATVSSLQTLVEAKSWLKTDILNNIKLAKESKKASNTVLKTNITHFIESNYNNPELSIELVSDHFNYNSIYFGKLFREMYNETFSEYITKLRIDKANTLLKENVYKIKEIGEHIGLYNPSYFVTWYKKNTGYSPSEYRNNNLKDK